LQARPEPTLDQQGTPVVRLQLTGQDDTPAWRAIYNEMAAKDDCPAEIDGPEGAPVLLVYLTDTSTDAAISSVLDRASFEHLHKLNTCILLRPLTGQRRARAGRGGGNGPSAVPVTAPVTTTTVCTTSPSGTVTCY